MDGPSNSCFNEFESHTSGLALRHFRTPDALKHHGHLSFQLTYSNTCTPIAHQPYWDVQLDLIFFLTSVTSLLSLLSFVPLSVAQHACYFLALTLISAPLSPSSYSLGKIWPWLKLTTNSALIPHLHPGGCTLLEKIIKSCCTRQITADDHTTYSSLLTSLCLSLRWLFHSASCSQTLHSLPHSADDCHTLHFTNSVRTTSSSHLRHTSGICTRVLCPLPRSEEVMALFHFSTCQLLHLFSRSHLCLLRHFVPTIIPFLVYILSLSFSDGPVPPKDML